MFSEIRQKDEMITILQKKKIILLVLAQPGLIMWSRGLWGKEATEPKPHILRVQKFNFLYHGH